MYKIKNNIIHHYHYGRFICNSQFIKKIYQGLANNFSAIETPTWALLLASSMRRYNYSCSILDCSALRLTEEEAIKEIEDSKCRLALLCFMDSNQIENFLNDWRNKFSRKSKKKTHLILR